MRTIAKTMTYEASNSGSNDTYRVLVADADPFVNRVISAGLDRISDFQVTSLARSSDGLRDALSTLYHIILWDISLPETSNLLPIIRASSPDSSLILMTAEDRPVLWEHLEWLDIADILQKPFGLEAMRSHINRAMKSSIPFTSSGQTELLKIGQQISISSPSGSWITRVIEINTHSFGMVGTPRVEAPDEVGPRTKLKVEIVGKDAIYQFSSHIIRPLNGQVSGWEASMPGSVHRIQRRKSLRVPLHTRGVLITFHPDGSEEESEVFLDDISLGGCTIIAAFPFTAGIPATIRISVLKEFSISLSGKISRVSPSSRYEDGFYPLSMNFDKLTPSQSSSLKKYLAEIQYGYSSHAVVRL